MAYAFQTPGFPYYIHHRSLEVSFTCFVHVCPNQMKGLWYFAGESSRLCDKAVGSSLFWGISIRAFNLSIHTPPMVGSWGIHQCNWATSLKTEAAIASRVSANVSRNGNCQEGDSDSVHLRAFNEVASEATWNGWNWTSYHLPGKPNLYPQGMPLLLPDYPRVTWTCRISLRALGKDRVKETKRLGQKMQLHGTPLVSKNPWDISRSHHHIFWKFSGAIPKDSCANCALKPWAFLTTPGAGCFMPTWLPAGSWGVHQLLATVPPSSTASLHADLLWPRDRCQTIWQAQQRDLMITLQKS